MMMAHLLFSLLLNVARAHGTCAHIAHLVAAALKPTSQHPNEPMPHAFQSW
jgi:hypothetical protein